MTNVHAALRDVADAVLAVVFAPACAACRETLERPGAGPVCARCWSAIQPITPPVCEACGDPLASARSAAVIAGGADLEVGPRCARCRDSSRVVDRARAAGAYEGSLRDILHAFKYDGRRSLARPLGRLMRAAGEEILRDADYLVPVPLHRRRRRERGFNQATDLAVTLGLPTIHALRRVRATAPQADLTATERQRNVRGAFALRATFVGRVFRRATRAGAVSLEGLCLVLIDDISTTGATLDACARVLKEAGAREVRALTVARAVARQP